MKRASFVQIFDETPPEDLGNRLKKASDASPENAAEAFDVLGLEIARRYHSGLISFEDADIAMNTVFSAMCHGQFFTDYFDSKRLAFQVFSAFDEGEFIHSGDSEFEDPIKKYTDPLITAILNEFANA